MSWDVLVWGQPGPLWRWVSVLVPELMTPPPQPGPGEGEGGLGSLWHLEGPCVQH